MPERHEYTWGTKELNAVTQFMMEKNFGDFRSLGIAACWVGTMMGEQVRNGTAPREETEELLKGLVAIMQSSFKAVAEKP